MWPMDAKVSLLYDLKQSVRVSEVVLHVWFGSNSSRGQSFMTERIRVRVSNDNFQTDDRLVLDHVDDAKHDDWGQPLAVTCRPDRAECRWVRVELTPRKGSSVYLAEAEIWGDGDTIAWETMDSRLAADFLSVAPGPGGLVALGGSNGGVYLADGQGRQVWRSETGDRVPTVWCGDLDGDGSPEVVAGSRDGKVYCYSRDGALRWTFACEPYHGRSGALVCVLAADVLYEGRFLVPVARALGALLAPGGSALVAEPGREVAAPFFDMLRDDGWQVRGESVTPIRLDGIVSRVEIVRLMAPGEPGRA